VRSLDRPAQGLTAFFIALFAIPPAALLVGMASERSFWIAVLSWAPLVVIPPLMRNPLRTLARAPRLVAWFCIGVTCAVFFWLGRGQQFNLAIAVSCGLALAIVESLAEYFEERRMADQ